MRVTTIYPLMLYLDDEGLSKVSRTERKMREYWLKLAVNVLYLTKSAFADRDITDWCGQWCMTLE